MSQRSWRRYERWERQNHEGGGLREGCTTAYRRASIRPNVLYYFVLAHSWRGNDKLTLRFRSGLLRLNQHVSCHSDALHGCAVAFAEIARTVVRALARRQLSHAHESIQVASATAVPDPR